MREYALHCMNMQDDINPGLSSFWGHAVGRVLIDSEAGDDRCQFLVEEELEVVGRIIDVHRT